MIVKLLEPLRVEKSLIEDLAQGIIDRGHEFVYYEERTTDPDELAERSEDADIVIIGNTPYSAAAFAKANNLKLINVAFTGFDHVDTKQAKEQGVKIANASGYADTAVSELVIGLTIAVYRELLQGDKDIRDENFPGPIQGREIKGKTVGVIGTGKIGQDVAKLFDAFGAKLLGYNRSEKEKMLALGMEYVELDELLERSDIVTLHLPMNDETKNTLSAEKIALMKESAILINAARGGIVDNDALAQALNEGKIAGAGIDVFDMEPPLPGDYPLLHSKNTVLAPHIAYLTDESMIERAEIAFDNVIKFIAGDPQNIVLD